MKLTLRRLKQWGACNEGVLWFKEQKDKEMVIILPKLIKENHFDWANWTIARLMTHEQKALYVIYAAESVLPIFESKNKKDKRPRLAIKAAKAFLKGDVTTTEVRTAADYAADAAYAAANAADYAAAYAAAYAAYAAAYAAAFTAAYAAAYAAYAAAYAAAFTAAYAAYAAANAADYAARLEFQQKQIAYGMELLGIKEK